MSSRRQSTDGGGLVIRPETAHDYPSIRQVVAAAFGSDEEADLVEAIRKSAAYRPELALIAETDGIAVGHVMVSTATLRHDSGEWPIALLSPIAVDPSRQRSGIGSALVAEVATRSNERGEAFIVLEGSPDYYGKLGFEAASKYGVQLPLPSWAPPEAAQILPLDGFDPTDPKLNGVVVYPAPFADLE
ncbi:MAG: N-acetyltransferase [Ilumatobacteraceae bacterium]|nr:N-acetyltransferase [Ilumatobacteraceae bacterium]